MRIDKIIGDKARTTNTNFSIMNRSRTSRTSKTSRNRGPSFGIARLSGAPRLDVSSDVSDTPQQEDSPSDVPIQNEESSEPSADSQVVGDQDAPRPSIKMNSKYAAMFGGDSADDLPPQQKLRAKVSAQKRSRPASKSSTGHAKLNSLSANTGPHSKSRKRVRKQAGFGMSMPRAIHRTLPKKGFGLQQGLLADYQ